MTDLHVDDFYKDAARVLVRLYGTFPREQAVYVEDICGHDEPDEFGLHSDRYLACLGAMVWLSQEGYLRYHSLIRDQAIDQAVLTARAFTLLAAPTGVFEHNVGAAAHDQTAQTDTTNFVAVLRAALAARSSAQIRDAMSVLMHRMHN